MGFKLQTRIKVVTIGEDVKYIPQYKGFMRIDTRYKFLAYTILSPFLMLHRLGEFLFWDEISDDYSISIGKQYSQQYAERLIDYFLDEQKEMSKPKPKKIVSYIKHP